MKTPAMAGPMELPIILNNDVIPIEVTIFLYGVTRSTIFINPTLPSDNPVEIVARATDTIHG